VLFPTPLPAKIPILCPFPTVIKPSTAFTPSGRTSAIISLVSGSGGVASTEYRGQFSDNSSSVIGSPTPFNVQPRSSSPTATCKGAPVFSTQLPSPTPSTSSYGIKRTLSSRKPTTSAFTGSVRLFKRIKHKSFNFALGPMDSIVRPTTLATFPN